MDIRGPERGVSGVIKTQILKFFKQRNFNSNGTYKIGRQNPEAVACEVIIRNFQRPLCLGGRGVRVYKVVEGVVVYLERQISLHVGKTMKSKRV